MHRAKISTQHWEMIWVIVIHLPDSSIHRCIILFVHSVWFCRSYTLSYRLAFTIFFVHDRWQVWCSWFPWSGPEVVTCSPDSSGDIGGWLHHKNSCHINNTWTWIYHQSISHIQEYREWSTGLCKDLECIVLKEMNQC